MSLYQVYSARPDLGCAEHGCAALTLRLRRPGLALRRPCGGAASGFRARLRPGAALAPVGTRRPAMRPRSVAPCGRSVGGVAGRCPGLPYGQSRGICGMRAAPWSPPGFAGRLRRALRARRLRRLIAFPARCGAPEKAARPLRSPRPPPRASHARYARSGGGTLPSLRFGPPPGRGDPHARGRRAVLRPSAAAPAGVGRPCGLRPSRSPVCACPRSSPWPPPGRARRCAPGALATLHRAGARARLRARPLGGVPPPRGFL